MKYLYELHCHTSEVSKCAVISAKDQVRYYKSLGFDGICITDHFLNGNTVVPKNLDYETRIDLFFESYYLAKEEGEKIGIKVFPGLEYTYGGCDILTYATDIDFLKSHPEIVSMRPAPYCNFIRENGGFVFHAHPFREAAYIEMIRLFPRVVDGVETINGCRTDFENNRANEYADNYGLAKICGSDNHTGEMKKIDYVLE